MIPSERGRVACVTGAADGIGRASALSLADAGFHVHVSDIDGKGAADVGEDIRRNGGAASAQVCDVRLEDEVAGLFAAIESESGRLDAMVVNAGIYPPEVFDETTVEVLDLIMGVNFRGAFLCTMGAVPLMESSGGGSIICVSSGAGTIEAATTPLAGTLPIYGASKAALDRWALGIAAELARRSIAMNVIWPGAVVRTAGVSRLGLSDTELSEGVDPEFVAPAITWLAQQNASDFSGQRVTSVGFGSTWGPGSSPPT